MAILVCLGDFGQIPGPSSVLFWLRVRVLHFPRTPPPFFPAQQKNGGDSRARGARARAARAKKHTSPPTIFK